MLTRLTFKLNSPQRLISSTACLFHGALLQKIDRQYGEFLHFSQLKPFSQYLINENNNFLWKIQTLDNNAYKHIILDTDIEHLKSIYLEQKDINIDIISCEKYELTQNELLDKTFFGTCPRSIKIRFCTPTSFKSNGKYQNYPTIYHIFSSLIKKYDAVNTENEINSPTLLDDFEKYINISSYNLRSTIFHIEGVKIPAFLGTLSLRINGPQQLVNLVHLLLEFGTFSGIGIKTALGMGALEIDMKW